MLVPMPWQGPAKNVPWPYLNWLADLKGRNWCALWQRWPGSACVPTNLPLGYDNYIVSFHLEPIDLDWCKQQSEMVQAPIIVLSDADPESFNTLGNVHLFQFMHWHRQVDLVQSWHGLCTPKHRPQFHASAFCNRITQSKLIIFAALVKHIGLDRCMLQLGNLLDDKNVHFGSSTGCEDLDTLTDYFFANWSGKTLSIDQFDTHRDNYQQFTSNPWANYLQDAAVHFTNESYHYSQMYDQIYPGPFITEKTIRCLVGGRAFVPVGQYRTYRRLRELGLEFNYGFDLSWDEDPGNLTRLSSIVRLIQHIATLSVEEISADSEASNLHNFDAIWSGKFYRNCEQHNHKTIAEIFQRFGH